MSPKSVSIQWIVPEQEANGSVEAKTGEQKQELHYGKIRNFHF
jgi:hypothetical protein